MYASGLLALIGFLDWLTGPDVPFALLYLVPLSFTTWFAGKNAGLGMAVACMVVEVSSDLAGAASPRAISITVMTGLSRFGFFVVAVLLMSASKLTSQRLERTVAERTSAMKKLGSQLAAAEDAERRRLAHDIHDAMGQTLSILKINLQSVHSRIDAAAAMDGHVKLSEAISMVDDLTRQTRTLTFDLYPAMLDDLGLVPTLHWYAEQFGRQAGVEITVSEQGTAEAIPQATGQYLFRGVKELFANAVRHGQAKQIIVTVHWRKDAIRMVIDDDGRGFDAAAVLDPQSRRGLGLAGLRERLASLGGTMDVESRPGEGTRVILLTPLGTGEV